MSGRVKAHPDGLNGWSHACYVSTVNPPPCRPYVCPYPNASLYRAGARWTCPSCGLRYKLSKPKRVRWWRNWSAPYGYWRYAGGRLTPETLAQVEVPHRHLFTDLDVRDGGAAGDLLGLRCACGTTWFPARGERV